MYRNGQKYSTILDATKTPRREEHLIADYTDDTDLIGHKKAQKTSAFIPIQLGLRTDRQRKISQR
jgi:hypothetical protein